jgi:hypothetical protein
VNLETGEVLRDKKGKGINKVIDSVKWAYKNNIE